MWFYFLYLYFFFFFVTGKLSIQPESTGFFVAGAVKKGRRVQWTPRALCTKETVFTFVGGIGRYIEKNAIHPNFWDDESRLASSGTPPLCSEFCSKVYGLVVYGRIVVKVLLVKRTAARSLKQREWGEKKKSH